MEAISTDNSTNFGFGSKPDAKELINKLPEAEKQKLQAILNDKQKLKEVLNSDTAKEIMKRLGADGKNG